MILLIDNYDSFTFNLVHYLQELGADHSGIAYVTATVTVWDRDPALAAEKLRLVENAFPDRWSALRKGAASRARKRC